MSYEYYDSVQEDAANVEYINGLYSYAMVLTRNPAEAEDLVQETYVRAMPAKGRPSEEGNVKGWLFKILRNVWLSQPKRRQITPQFVQTHVTTTPVSSMSSMMDTKSGSCEACTKQREGEQVRAAIQRLPTEFGEIILLREFENLSYHEIAGLLDCPAGTVMSRLATARSRLRILLSSMLTRSESSRGIVRNEGLQ